MTPIVLATANNNKVAEIREILVGIDLVPRPEDIPDVDETEATFEGNARLKAVAVVAATGMPALADDSGLEVDALGGAPGVFSARYAGENATYEQNVQKLLADLDGVENERRTARFRSVVLLRYPDGGEIQSEGTVEGRVTTEPVAGNGFGYDPVFVPDDGDGRTFSQMTQSEKNAISHRGRALAGLRVLIRS